MIAMHACAISKHGVLRCWGDNTHGEIGIGLTGEPGPDGSLQVSSPAVVTPGVTYREVSAGVNATCAIRTDGALYCWGWNQGLLLDGTREDRALPVRIGTDSDWEQISVGLSVACGVRDHGKLLCWWDTAPKVVIEGGPQVVEVSLNYNGGIALDALGSTYLADLSVPSSLPFHYAPELTKAAHVAMPVYGALGITPEGRVAEFTAGPHLLTSEGVDRFRTVAGAYDIVAVGTDGTIHFEPRDTQKLTLTKLDPWGSPFVDARESAAGVVCALRETGEVWCLDMHTAGKGDQPTRILDAE
jgi:hypothetical protein